MNTEEEATYEEGLRGGLAVYGCVYVIITFLIAIQYIGMDVLYKVDNFVIFMQILTLSLFSLEIKFTLRDFYRFLYGFRWTIGNWDINHLQNSILFLNDPLYIEYSEHNAPYLLTVDNNFIRNCFPLIFLNGLATILFIAGYILLKRQIPCKLHQKLQNRKKKKEEFTNLSSNRSQLPKK